MAERALLYARISFDRAGQAAGVQRQLHDLRALAEQRGYKVVEEVTDNDISAYAHRPGFDQLWKLVRSGAVDHTADVIGTRKWSRKPGPKRPSSR